MYALLPIRRPAGYTVVELLASLVIAALILSAMTGVVDTALSTGDDAALRSEATQEARFAIQRMTTAITSAGQLILPLADNPATNWRENVRQQSNPAVAPEGDSTQATAVLAVTLDPTLDLDEDGNADADNDNDGEIDENPGRDMSNDGEPGLKGIDDDGDGSVDEQNYFDDDEDGSHDEDTANQQDDDSDGSADEDLGGGWGEDWLDPVVFFLNGATLLERRPDLDPSDGNDYSEYPIAENVTFFSVERLLDSGRRFTVVEISVEVTLPSGDPSRISTRVRVGGAP